ncbi:MAG: MFS transporter [Herpetosiphonaceae bacterium]|nr:MFS transporter [Herpetosiphonaceae bacterium]
MNTPSNEARLAQEPAGPSRFTILFLISTAFLNSLGFTIISPVLPFIVRQYVGDPHNLATVVGWLTASYAICQFVAAPALGVLSDRFGRRPLLLLCLLGSVIGYVIFGIGGALWVLFLSRIIDGLTGANYSILAAYIGDVSKPEERGKLFGQIGGVVGVGFIVGPVIGGFAAKWGYSAPLYLAAVVLLANTIWGYFAMSESLQRQHRATQVSLSNLNPLKQLRNIFAMPRLRWLLVTGLCYFFPFAMFTTELAVLAIDKLSWTPQKIGLLLLLIGCIDIVMQGFLAERLIPRFGELRLTIAGLICEAIAYVLVGAVALTPQPVLMLVGIIFLAVGSGLLEPSLNGLTSAATGPREQGTVQGGNMALRSLTNIAGPLVAGVLYIRLGGETPYWLGAVVLLLGIGAILLAAQQLDKRHPIMEAEPANG